MYRDCLGLSRLCALLSVGCARRSCMLSYVVTRLFWLFGFTSCLLLVHLRPPLVHLCSITLGLPLVHLWPTFGSRAFHFCSTFGSVAVYWGRTCGSHAIIMRCACGPHAFHLLLALCARLVHLLFTSGDLLFTCQVCLVHVLFDCVLPSCAPLVHFRFTCGSRAGNICFHFWATVGSLVGCSHCVAMRLVFASRARSLVVLLLLTSGLPFD